MKRIVAVVLTVLSALPFGVAASDPCIPRLLVLSAFPGEIDRLLTEMHVDRAEAVEGRSLFVGTLRGNDVVLGLTGIGLVNAERTARAALERFGCGSGPGITGVVFTGVAGGRTFIGDVTAPARWTEDNGTTWLHADAHMLAVAEAVKQSGSVGLASDVPTGDAACVGHDPDLVRTIRVDHAPEIIVGGDGKSADSFGGRAFPCFPGGGDVFGCEPCRAPVHAPDVQRFGTGIVPFLDPAFFFGYFASPPPAGTTYDAEDMETAAVARVASSNGIPFIAFRAVSDGRGDPLMLPGFPFQFFFYRQLAADNAAETTLAFLGAWAEE